MKGDKTKPATDAEVTTVDPESGFEGERRGESVVEPFIHTSMSIVLMTIVFVNDYSPWQERARTSPSPWTR